MVDLENAEKMYLALFDEDMQIEKIPGYKNGLKIANGSYLPMYVRNLSIIKSMELRDTDTFVIGYPKSG